MAATTPANYASRRRRPFLLAAGAALILCIAVARLPGSFVDLLARRSALDSYQQAWLILLLLTVTAVQALHGGFVLLRPERVATAAQDDRRLAGRGAADVAGLIARNAAAMALLTLVYGLAAFWLTRRKEIFW